MFITNHTDTPTMDEDLATIVNELHEGQSIVNDAKARLRAYLSPQQLITPLDRLRNTLAKPITMSAAINAGIRAITKGASPHSVKEVLDAHFNK